VLHTPRPARLHYRWVILAVTCLTVLMAAGVTAVPAVLIHPLEVEFGWDRAELALAVSINVLLYGLAGPFAGGMMLRFGPRCVMLTSLILIACGVVATTQLRPLVQLYLLWGVVVGLGTGSTALVLSATVVNRWFTMRRGLALGLLGAALAAYGAGVFRVWFGNYGLAFTTAGLLAVTAAGLALMIRHRPGRTPEAIGFPAPTPAAR
jgi:MFS family permease